jgi:hypothetical protein
VVGRGALAAAASDVGARGCDVGGMVAGGVLFFWTGGSDTLAVGMGVVLLSRICVDPLSLTGSSEVALGGRSGAA